MRAWNPAKVAIAPAARLAVHPANDRGSRSQSRRALQCAGWPPSPPASRVPGPDRRTCGARAPSRRPPAAAFVQLVEPGVGVGLQAAGKIPQMLLRMIALAIRRVREPNRRRIRRPTGPVIANVRPQASRLGLSCPRRQHRYWRVVGVQLVTVE